MAWIDWTRGYAVWEGSETPECKNSIRDVQGRIRNIDATIANMEQREAAETMVEMSKGQSGNGALMSRQAEPEPETPRERRPLPAGKAEIGSPSSFEPKYGFRREMW